jgi:hypothetical protein
MDTAAQNMLPSKSQSMNLIPRYIQLKGKNKKDQAPEVCTEVHIL